MRGLFMVLLAFSGVITVCLSSGAEPCSTCPTTPKPGATIKCPECANVNCSPNMCYIMAPIPYPGDCTKFCLCDSSGSIEMICPPGLVFNPNIGACDWSSNSNCSNTDPYPGCNGVTTTTTTLRPTTTTTQRATTTTTTERVTTTTTDRATTTTTQRATTTTTKNLNDQTLPCETPAPVRIPCPQCVSDLCNDAAVSEGAHLSYPGDCSKYCQCTPQGAFEFSCPGGLLFDPILQVCNYANYVQCTNADAYPGCNKLPTTQYTSKPTLATSSTTHKPIENCPTCVNSYCTPEMCNQSKLISHPNSCLKFCQCDMNGSIAQDCPDGTHFDPIEGKCIWGTSCTLPPNLYPTCTTN